MLNDVWNHQLYWEFHHPKWRTHIFRRDWNHQPGIQISSKLPISGQIVADSIFQLLQEPADIPVPPRGSYDLLAHGKVAGQWGIFNGKTMGRYEENEDPQMDFNGI